MINAARTLLADPAYRRLFFKTGSYRAVVKAGFIPEPFHDPRVRLDNDVYVLPSSRMLPGSTILLMTGCFAPLHYGHIEAMERAREALENEGKIVSAGYFSPCHEGYVFEKTRSRFYSDNTRIGTMYQSLLKDAPWLRPSSWELRQRGPMNFTSVYRAFVKHFVHQEVVFVYGSDNKNFRLAFLNGELNVCVNRTEKYDRPVVCKGLKTNTLYINGGQYKAWSSTMMRDLYARKAASIRV